MPRSKKPINPKTSATLPAVAEGPAPSGLSWYLQKVAKIPLLSAEEEHRLAIRVFEDKDPEAAQILVQSNLRFVLKLAFEYARYGAKVMDLIQEGNVGLIKAVRDFNPYKDTRLTTYAVWWIKSYLNDYILRNWSLVRIGTTAAQKKLFYRLKKEQEKFEREKITPEPKAIAMNLGVDEADVKLMQERLAGGDVSLTAPPSDDPEAAKRAYDQRLADEAPLPSSVLEENEQAVLFKKALEEFQKGLDDRELVIFRERMLAEKPRTLVEIGEDFGFTKERARQLEERIKAKLRDFLAAKYPDISVR